MADRPTFGAWLIDQAERADNIGKLAGWWKDLPDRGKIRSVPGVETYVKGVQGAEQVLPVLQTAVDEYRATTGLPALPPQQDQLPLADGPPGLTIDQAEQARQADPTGEQPLADYARRHGLPAGPSADFEGDAQRWHDAHPGRPVVPQIDPGEAIRRGQGLPPQAINPDAEARRQQMMDEAAQDATVTRLPDRNVHRPGDEATSAEQAGAELERQMASQLAARRFGGIEHATSAPASEAVPEGALAVAMGGRWVVIGVATGPLMASLGLAVAVAELPVPHFDFFELARRASRG